MTAPPKLPWDTTPEPGAWPAVNPKGGSWHVMVRLNPSGPVLSWGIYDAKKLAETVRLIGRVADTYRGDLGPDTLNLADLIDRAADEARRAS